MGPMLVNPPAINAIIRLHPHMPLLVAAAVLAFVSRQVAIKLMLPRFCYDDDFIAPSDVIHYMPSQIS
jgi:hypothetical protein